MLLISKGKEKDHQSIVDIGRVFVPEAHEGSCAPEDLKQYTTTNYNETEIKKELWDDNNIYHILKCDDNVF